MVIKRCLFFIIFLSCDFLYGSQLYISDNKVYIDGKIFSSPLIKDELASNIYNHKDTFEIVNQYYASAVTKSEVRYVFDKETTALTNIIKINYDVKFARHYGYDINVLNGINFIDVKEQYIESLEESVEPEDYNYLQKDTCLQLNLKLNDKDIKLNSCQIDKESVFLINYQANSNNSIDMKGYSACKLEDEGEVFLPDSCKNVYFIENKTTLYSKPNITGISKMYLIKGDQVTILDEQTDDTNQKWYFINYKGKKDINMWIKAEAIDVAE